MRKVTSAILAAACFSTLSACAGMGGYHGLGSEPMATAVVYSHPANPITESQYRGVVELNNHCFNIANQQLSSAAESAAASGIAGAAAGGVGTGLGALAGDVGTIAQMGPYGAVAGGVHGVNAGLQLHSSAIASVAGTCTRDLVADPASNLGGVYVTTAYVRSRNRSDRIPEWVVPDGAVQGQQVPQTDRRRITTPPPPPPR